MTLSQKRLFACLGVGMLSVALLPTLLGFITLESRWPPGEIPMELQLGSAGGLIDGSADWDACARDALAEWNANLAGAERNFAAVAGSNLTPERGDDVNTVFWADDIFGTPFGSSTLAVAASQTRVSDGVDTQLEVDVLFNTAKGFNCYRGPLRVGAVDLRRVALHEFGHVLGLDHPDEAVPPQLVDAVMNSILGDADALRSDDIQGALTLYGVPVVGIAFPPRDQVLDFFLALEAEYRDTLGRAQDNQGFVDAEGSAVWFPEWLRYVLNDCSVSDAATRVLLQIRGQGIQPACGVVAQGVINFPPRDQSLEFLNTLDGVYRDELSRPVELSHINLEGKAVWLQEYLRYRVNGCTNQEATDRVFQQIRGGGIAPVCASGDPPTLPSPPEYPGCSIETISSGTPVAGTLDQTDCTAPDWASSPADLYRVDLAAGDYVRITHKGTTLSNPYLILVDPAGTVVATDDDGGGDLNAAIDGFVLAAGTYTIQATASYGGNQFGDYTLTLTVGLPTCSSTPIFLGVTSLRGELSTADCEAPHRAGSYADLYPFDGTLGDQVTIALTGDDLSDPYLLLVGPDGSVVTENDDGGTGLNSLISGFTLPATGSYTIEATAFSDETGSYTLSLTSGATAIGTTGWRSTRSRRESRRGE